MKLRQMNHSQRVIAVIGLGFAILLFGEWVTTLGSRLIYGWVAYAPTSNSYNFPGEGGLHPWVRLLLWLILIGLWTALSALLLRGSRSGAQDAQA